MYLNSEGMDSTGFRMSKSAMLMTALLHPLNPPPFRFLSNSALDANLMAIICFTEEGFFHDKNEKKIWKLKVTSGFFSK